MRNLIFLGGEDVSARIEISKKFIDLGYKINIIGTEKEDKFIKNRIDYKKYNFSREFTIFDDLRSIKRLRDILKEQPPNSIVHAFDTKPTLFLPIASFGLKNNIKISRTITGMGRIFTEDSLKNRILKRVYNQLQKSIKSKVDFTIFQNCDDAKYFIKNSLTKKDRATIIRSSGINLEKFTSDIDRDKIKKLKEELKIDNNKTFILVSRMVKQKGILTYLKSAKICHQEGYRYNFLLVGQLDTDNSITLGEIEKYSKYVKYLGRRDDVKELLSLSDIFVLPTYYREGVPRVLLEASALGLALIATDMPGCRDVVIDDYNGKRIKIKDERDLASTMIFMAEDEDRLNRYKKNSMEKVKEFDLNLVVKNYDKVYKRIENVESTTI